MTVPGLPQPPASRAAPPGGSPARPPMSRAAGLALALGITAAIFVVDVLAGRELVLVGLLVVGPIIAALTLGPWDTGVVTAVALAAGLVAGAATGDFLSGDHVPRLLVIVAGGGLAIAGSALRIRLEHGRREAVAAAERNAALAEENARLLGELRESAARLDALFRTAPIGLAFLDRDLRFVRVNEQLARFNGLTVDAHLGHRVDEALPALSPGLLARMQAAAQGEPTHEHPVHGPAADAPGEEVDFAVSYYPVPDASGTIAGVGAIVVDTTARSRAELERERLVDALERERGRLELISDVARLLDRPLDVRERLEELARLLLPGFGDVCVVRTAGAGGAATIVASTTPGLEAEMLDYLTHYPVTLDPATPMGQALEEHEPVPYAVDDAMESAPSDRQAAVARLGIRSGVAVPLHARGQPVGVLAISSIAERSYSERDLAVLRLVARRASLAVDDARRFEEQAHVAAELQRELLPPAPPAWPGVELACTYRPATAAAAVGGDFYDFFEVSGGHALVIGDVSGKGIEAAALTALVRHAARVAARTLDDARDVLAEVNRAILDAAMGDQFCTVAYAMLCERDGPGVDLRITCAGHPSAVIVRADGSVERAGSPGSLLGAFETLVLERDEISLMPGDAVVLYTDGLVEARTDRRIVDDAEVEAAAARAAGSPAADMLARVESDLLAAGGAPQDDVAIVVARLTA